MGQLQRTRMTPRGRIPSSRRTMESKGCTPEGMLRRGVITATLPALPSHFIRPTATLTEKLASLPAPLSTTTDLKPALRRAATPAGVSATRRSFSNVSRGTPAALNRVDQGGLTGWLW